MKRRAHIAAWVLMVQPFEGSPGFDLLVQEWHDQARREGRGVSLSRTAARRHGIRLFITLTEFGKSLTKFYSEFVIPRLFDDSPILAILEGHREPGSRRLCQRETST